MKKILFNLALISSYIIGFYLIFIVDKNPVFTKIGYGIIIVNIIILTYLYFSRKNTVTDFSINTKKGC